MPRGSLLPTKSSSYSPTILAPGTRVPGVPGRVPIRLRSKTPGTATYQPLNDIIWVRVIVSRKPFSKSKRCLKPLASPSCALNTHKYLRRYGVAWSVSLACENRKEGRTAESCTFALQ